MATIRKVGKRWRAEVRRKGTRESRYFDSKMRARAWAEELEARVGGPETVGDALEKYSSEVSPTKKGCKWEQTRLLKLSRYDIAEKRIALATAVDVANWRDQRLTEVSSGSVRRELGLLSSVFQKAVREWHWCDTNPVKEIDKPADSRPRKRRITDDEIERLKDSLGFNETVETKQHEVAVMFLLAIESAMRLGEMCDLDPDNIHLGRRYVHLVDTKNGESRDVPLSTEAVRLLKLVPEGFSVSSESASTLFRKARRRAGVEGLKFHDSRREALSRLSKRMDVMTLAKISGHKDIKVLLNTYYAPTVDDLVSFFD